MALSDAQLLCRVTWPAGGTWVGVIFAPTRVLVRSASFIDEDDFHDQRLFRLELPSILVFCNFSWPSYTGPMNHCELWVPIGALTPKPPPPDWRASLYHDAATIEPPAEPEALLPHAETPMGALPFPHVYRTGRICPPHSFSGIPDDLDPVALARWHLGQFFATPFGYFEGDFEPAAMPREARWSGSNFPKSRGRFDVAGFFGHWEHFDTDTVQHLSDWGEVQTLYERIAGVYRIQAPSTIEWC